MCDMAPPLVLNKRPVEVQGSFEVPLHMQTPLGSPSGLSDTSGLSSVIREAEILLGLPAVIAITTSPLTSPILDSSPLISNSSAMPALFAINQPLVGGAAATEPVENLRTAPDETLAAEMTSQKNHAFDFGVCQPAQVCVIQKMEASFECL